MVVMEAFRDCRGLVFDTVHPGDGILDFFGDLNLELRWRSPRLGYAHLHNRHVDVGKACNGQLGEAHQT